MFQCAAAPNLNNGELLLLCGLHPRWRVLPQKFGDARMPRVERVRV